MKTLAKALVLSAAVAVAAAAPLTSANADDWHHHHWHHGNGDGWALGALGLATGAIIGGAIASDPGPRYYVDGPVEYAPPPPPPPVAYRTYEPVYAAGSLRPWSGPWYRYCEATYRSFDPRSGTFMGYDGRSHFCAAN